MNRASNHSRRGKVRAATLGWECESPPTKLTRGLEVHLPLSHRIALALMADEANLRPRKRKAPTMRRFSWEDPTP